MKQLFKVFYIFMLVQLSACINRNTISITDSNIGDTIQILQNLSITFNRDLVQDSLIDKWDSTTYLKIEPSIKGLYKWTSKNQLLFSPTTGFEPATNYRLSLTSSLAKYTNKDYAVHADILTFSTAPLILEGNQTWWTQNSETENLTLQVALNFNYEVDPNEIGKKLHLFINGRSIVTTMASSIIDKQITLKAEGINNAEASSGILNIKIDKGFQCVKCGEKTLSELLATIQLTNIKDLVISNYESTFQKGEGVITVFTNQPIHLNDKLTVVDIKPKIEFQLEKTESGFQIKGNFISGLSYDVTINKSLKGALGGVMNEDYKFIANFGQQEPGLAFTNSKGVYLSSRGSKQLGIQIVNIPKVEVSITKIYENNILAFMRQNRYTDYDESGNVYNYNDYDLSQFGDEILKQTYIVKNLPLQNGSRLLNLDFRDKINFNGIYLVTARSSENQWLSTSKLVSISDIGLIAREGADEIVVFANSIKDAKPLSGVQITITSTNNQELYNGITNGDGVIKFSELKTKYPNFKTGLITAKTNSDFNYMLLSDAQVELSRFETGGYHDNFTGSMAFIYGDREIYRTGDTINVNTIVRNKQWKTIQDLSVKLKLQMPNGKELTTIRGLLNKEGAFTTKFIIPSSGVTGIYNLELYTSNDILIATKNLSIEEFIPDRISLKVDINKDKLLLTDTLKINGLASNLFGPPASNRNYELQLNLSKVQFQPKGFEQFQFGLGNIDNVEFPSILRQGKTDANGKYSEKINFESSYSETGMLQGKIFTTVFDETGRPVNRSQNINIQTQPIFLGIRSSEYYAGVGQPIQFNIIALNGEGKKLSSTAEFQLIKINYNNIMERSYGDHFRYVSQKEEKQISSRQITVGVNGITIPFTPNESGEYAIRLYNPRSKHYVSLPFYAYGWGFTNSGAFSVNTQGAIDITSDKIKYSPNEKAKLLFKTPFNGKLLVTVERENLIEYHYLETNKKSAELTLNLSEKYLPNVYITATLFKPLDDGAIPLTVAHGVLPLTIEKPNSKIPVEIKVSPFSRSNTSQLITIKTLPKSNIEVTVAVVDEGILQLRNTKTPDPHGFFYQKRALDVNSYDVYPNLLPDLKLRRSSPGGDGYSLAKRVNPITNKRVKLVSSWSGILHTNANGIASYTLKIPQFSGDLRVMAVAYKDDAFGSSDTHIKVADPIVISTGLPRFVSPNDTILVSVTLTNTTNKNMNLTPVIKCTGGLSIIKASNSNLILNANSENKLTFQLSAPSYTGVASVSIQVPQGSETYSDKTDITIRPAASLQVRSGSGILKSGVNNSIDLSTGFISNSTESKLVISRSPIISFADQLSYLLDYPHGCAEQTISSAFPQLYFQDLAKSITNKPNRVINIQANIQAAISKLQSQQLYNGAITTWPGGSDENWWTSIYALHFLTEAQKLGYEVNNQMVEKIYDYLNDKIKNKKTDILWYYDFNEKLVSKTIPAKDIFYSLYVLSINKRGDRSIMNYYKSRSKELAIDSKYLLASTYLITGDRKSYLELLPQEFSGEKAISTSGGNYSSYIRDESLVLNALLATDPNNIQVAEIVKRLSREIKNQPYINTQERAFAFLALGKFMKQNNLSNATANLETNGGKNFIFDGKDLVLRNEITNSKIAVNVKGQGNLYYYWTTTGLTLDGSYKSEDRNLKVRKVFLDRYGKPIDKLTFSQNQLVVVKITLENSGRNTIENIVVTDILPAGFEIENPRVSAVPELDWIKDNTETEYLDMRDDRINLFTRITTKPLNFYYLVRAVSAGSYSMGPVSADAMYDGENHSIFGSGRIKIINK